MFEFIIHFFPISIFRNGINKLMINFIIIRTVTGIHPFIQTFVLLRTFYSLFRPFFSLALFVRVNIIKTLLSGDLVHPPAYSA